jgi:hypothetical protein
MYSLSDIVIKFKNQPELNIVLDDNSTVDAWVELFKKNYQQEFPIFRDQKKYTLAYLNQLALQAKNELNWNCETDIKSIEDTIRLHKNLETMLANGFNSIPAEYDNLIHELHFCLHKAEYIDIRSQTNNRQWLQIEWFNDDGVPLDLTFEHIRKLKFGDIRLQNPYVGHIPLQVYDQNDYENIFQTCKFHDFVRPGLYIHTGSPMFDINLDEYIAWWQTNASEFVIQHGMNKILHYTGHPVIGRVTNLNDLEIVVNSNDILELEYVFTK